MDKRSPKTYKVVVLGDSSVGKTSLLTYLVFHRFSERIDSTIGASFFAYQRDYRNCKYTLNLWDTAGQEKYHSIIPMYIRHADVILMVYDATNIDSYSDLVNTWIPFLTQQKDDYSANALIYIIGNKMDLVTDRSLIEKGKQVATEFGFRFEETSAKTGLNVSYLFDEIIAILDVREQEPSDTRTREQLRLPTFQHKSARIQPTCISRCVP